MKKLVFLMGSVAAILLTSSCTADSPVDSNNEKLTTSNKITAPQTGEVVAGDDDKDLPHD